VISSDPGAAAASDVRLSGAIMTHPGRIDAARRLRDLHPDLRLEVICDPEPDRKGNLGAARAAWSAVADGATHHLVLEDDVTLCPGFAQRVRAVIASQPRAAISLFAEWGSWTATVARVAALHGVSFAEVVDHYLPHQAAVLPAAAAAGFGDFAEHEAWWPGCDVVLLQYLRSAGIACLVHLPNLVEHRDLPSLIGRRSEFQGRRMAVCYAGDTPAQAPGTQAPGSMAISGLRVVPYFAWYDAQAMCRVRDSGAGDGWRQVPTAELLDERGAANPALTETFGDTVSSLGDAGLLRQRVGDPALGALWTTAYTLGLVAAGAGRLSGNPAAGPLARPALATLAPGGLRRMVPPSDLGWLASRLGPLAAAAVRLAVSDVAQGRAAPIS
jgi:hypothetical protein